MKNSDDRSGAGAKPADKRTEPRDKRQAESREDRLKAALKANMARRKAQAKARRDGAADKDQGQ